MQQETVDREASLKERALSNAGAEALTTQQRARDAAASVPGRRNRPAQSSSKQQQNRLRKAYAAYSHLPKELQDNEYITTGYRVELDFWDSIKSLFGLHNETGNIWTHLIGFVIFLALTIVTVFAKPVPLALGSPQLVEMENQLYTFARSNWVSARSTWSNVRRLEAQMTEYGRTNLLPIIDDIAAAEARLVSYGSSGYRGLELRVFRAAAALLDITWPVKRWPVYVFTAGAMACLLTSTVCHLFGCCARHVSQLIWRFDYVGIALLIVCSFYPPVYYGFMCYPWWQMFYLALITALGIGTMVVSVHNSFQAKDYRVFRASLFAGLGMTGIVPVIHGWAVNYDIAAVHSALSLDVLMGLIYLTGAILYACRFPERMFPGKFDLAFSSHQLFHVCVVVAAAIHYKAIFQLLAWRDATGGPGGCLKGSCQTVLPPMQLTTA
ncbi:TPA: hypothetical protein ACH3X2_006294 [Trebouxia sp. C0005]